MIKLEGVSKTYYLDGAPVPVLKHISLEVQQGDFLAIMGASGSGKTTLLNLIGCLDLPDAGQYWFGDLPIFQAKEADLAVIRNRHIGFVFQSFNLIPRIDAQRNVELPMVYAGVPPHIREQRALAALGMVGLRDRANHASAALSGGQQQRVSIARSIVNNPNLIIADEPTGALDARSSAEVMQIFNKLNASGKTIVMVTHEKEIAAHANRTVYVKDGYIM